MRTENLDAKSIERFLEHLANVSDDPNDLRRLQKKYSSNFLPSSFLLDSPLLRLEREQREKFDNDSLHETYTSQDDQEASLRHLTELRWILRKAWREADPRLRQWHAFDLRRRFHRMMNPDREQEPPDATPFEQAVYYFQQNHQRARYCQNPECFNPYYISSHLKPTRFCNPKCAGPAQKAVKLEWWNKHKQEMLRKRKAQRKQRKISHKRGKEN